MKSINIKSCECKIIKFQIPVSEIQNLWNKSDKNKGEDLLKFSILKLITNDWFDLRSEENFNEDLDACISTIKKI